MDKPFLTWAYVTANTLCTAWSADLEKVSRNRTLYNHKDGLLTTSLSKFKIIVALPGENEQ